ncbi:MAG: formyltransferase family protein [Candidatus Woesearchaeota archaeon]|nr:formyltransferase family protein [Candidatus Woesearchaeota archaeon]
MTEKITPIYSGKYEDFNWVGFGSGSGTNLRECAKVIKPKLIFSDKENAGLLVLEELANVEKRFLKKEEGEKSIDYNKRILDLLKRYEKENDFAIDLIVLGGYMRLVKEPLLSCFKDKIINVHPADLSILDFSEFSIPRDSRDHFVKVYQYNEPRRKYIGDDAVYDAIKAGETKTRSSVIIVDGKPDHGEILAQGHVLPVDEEFLRLPVQERDALLRQYIDGTKEKKGHQGRQKEISDWPALTTVLKMIAEGRIALGTKKTHYTEWRTVYADEKAVGYGGFQVK